MSEPTVEEAVERIKALGVANDEEEIRQVLAQCNNNAEVGGVRPYMASITWVCPVFLFPLKDHEHKGLNLPSPVCVISV